MKYLDLFNELQLSRDYFHDKKSGADWRYRIDHELKRIYLEVQETKTFWDWLHNFNIIPITITNCLGQSITVPRGANKQANAIISDITNRLLIQYSDYSWYFSGWSQGGMSSGITGFMLKGFVKNAHYIGWGTPAFLGGNGSLTTFINSFDSLANFLYEDDWIKAVIPIYKRPEGTNVIPVNPDNPSTMDQRHRVYGHCKYIVEEF